jgi:hypothetical protein
MKQKCLSLNTKLEVISLYKTSSSSKTGKGKQYGWTSTLFSNTQTKHEISIIQYDGRLVTEINEEH